MLTRGRIPLANLYISKLYNLAVNCSYVIRKRHTQQEVDYQMKKAMMRKNLRKRFDLASEISLYESDQYRIKTKDMKVTSRSSKIRNKTVANLIRNELQNLVDSGELGEEIQLLNLIFTKATLSSYNRCQIFWEPFMSTKDLEVANMLNKLTAKVRHLLTTNLIMNNVPELQFYMDGESYRIAMVDEVLKNEPLDVGAEPDAVSPAFNGKDSCIEADQAYGLDRDGILKRLAAVKNKTSTEKT